MEVNMERSSIRSHRLQRLVNTIKRVVHLDRVRPIYPLDPLSQFKIDLQEWVDSNDGTSRYNKLIAQEKINRVLNSRRTRLHLNELSLHTIPPLYVLGHLTYLNLSNNNIQHIEPRFFSHLGNLTCLCLLNNHIHSIDSQLFSDLESLELLYISDNDLNSIDPQAFSNLRHLRDITLYSNNLDSIDAQLWTNLHELQRIHLGDNRLTQFGWPRNNSSHPEIILVGNYFSNEIRRELLSRPNHPRYVFEFRNASRERELTGLSAQAIERTRERSGGNPYNITELTLKDLTRILDRWGVSTTSDVHEFIINEKDPDKMREYTNLVLFFDRLFLGLPVPHPQSIYRIVREIWIALENQFPDTQQLDTCVIVAEDGVSSCTDRIRLCLIQMSLNCSLCDAQRVEKSG